MRSIHSIVYYIDTIYCHHCTTDVRRQQLLQHQVNDKHLASVQGKTAMTRKCCGKCVDSVHKTCNGLLC